MRLPSVLVSFGRTSSVVWQRLADGGFGVTEAWCGVAR